MTFIPIIKYNNYLFLLTKQSALKRIVSSSEFNVT